MKSGKCLWLMFGLSCSGLAQEKAGVGKVSWLDSRKAQIENWRTLSKDERFDKLTKTAEGLSRLGEGMSEDQRAIHDLALSEILSVPGIGAHYEEVMRRIKVTLRDQGNKTSYDLKRVIAFEEMKQIPSPEIVKVLGELLDDKEDEPPMPREGQDYVDRAANDHMAASALRVLIANPPVKKDDLHPYFSADIEVWKLWYAQVKAGTRGFQFKGDEAVHYLAAPVKEERRAPPEKTIEAPAVIPAESPGGPVSASTLPEIKQSPAKKKSGPIPLLIASAVLLASLGWVWLSKRKRRRAD